MGFPRAGGPEWLKSHGCERAQVFPSRTGSSAISESNCSDGLGHMFVVLAPPPQSVRLLEDCVLVVHCVEDLVEGQCCVLCACGLWVLGALRSCPPPSPRLRHRLQQERHERLLDHVRAATVSL